MKYLRFPIVNDVQKTTELSENALLYRTTFPHLRHRLADVLAAYQGYESAHGDALCIPPLNLLDPLKGGLQKNYSGAPEPLAYIADVRKSSPRVCAMCGSLKTHTLDHVFPKGDYAEYAVFSKNLVPACDCNSKRGTALVDRGASVRVLHPYFDQCLSERLLSCNISPDLVFPSAKIVISYVQPSHPLAASIQFHTESIVLRTEIIDWLSGQWVTAVDNPGAIIHTLPEPHTQVPNINAMNGFLESALARYDASYGTPNNWQSIFIHGLLASSEASEWLMLKHNGTV